MKINWKTIGLMSTIVGGALTLLSNIADDKKMEETVEEKVQELLNKKEEESV